MLKKFPSFSLGNETPHLTRQMHRNISIQENAGYQEMQNILRYGGRRKTLFTDNFSVAHRVDRC